MDSRMTNHSAHSTSGSSPGWGPRAKHAVAIILLVLLVLIVYLPFLHLPFGTYSLPLVDWLIVIGLALTISPVLELAKWMERKGWFGSLI